MKTNSNSFRTLEPPKYRAAAMTAEIETMIQTLSEIWNVTIRSPWQSETETLHDWELNLIPREGHWGDYPKFTGQTLREAVTPAMAHCRQEQGEGVTNGATLDILPRLTHK